MFGKFLFIVEDEVIKCHISKVGEEPPHFKLKTSEDCDTSKGGGSFMIESEDDIKEIIFYGESTSYGMPTTDTYNQANYDCFKEYTDEGYVLKYARVRNPMLALEIAKIISPNS